MRRQTSRLMGISAILGGGLLVAWTSPAEAGPFGKRRGKVVAGEMIVSPPVVVAPPPVVVEPSRVKVRRRKIVIRERRGVVARIPAVFAGSRVEPPPPMAGRGVIRSGPVVEDRIIESRPLDEEPPIRLEPPAEPGLDPLPG